MKVTGTMVNYYIHCKRQCWLFANKINLEDNSEEVRIGKLLHELKTEKAKHKELSIEQVKIDKLTEDYLVEIKKSDADVEAVTWQVLLYLKIIKNKGIERKGKIEFIEKKKQSRKTMTVILTTEQERRLDQMIQQIEQLIAGEEIPAIRHDKKCNKCAYYDYCYI
ncbi:CRISPR-associated protein Cas4 [Hazenella sp. IB182353]|uniref:CRISPR-associated protein Cas4 n=1 Tax=Polycladospora coralii TaxID=2771432 RepID=UPI001745CE6B|nr:CRISPR-associated protein Cas4 [Polycladospora coralii]